MEKPIPPKSQIVYEGYDFKKFWSVIHNLVAHPLLVTGTKWADKFHDWTANKM